MVNTSKERGIFSDTCSYNLCCEVRGGSLNTDAVISMGCCVEVD